MSTLSGFKRSQFWSAKAASMYEGAPYRFNECMTEKKFDAILLALSYTTNNNAPAYRDRFWEVRQSIVAWNENMAAIFTPSWVSCLGESMSPWSTRWTCPGWMFVPRKPHPFGNEYHSICCAMTMIMYAIEIVIIITEIYFTLSRSSRTNSQEKSTHAGGTISKVVIMRPLE